MKRNKTLSLLFHTAFMVFLLAPLVIVMIVSFTDKGFISYPSDGLSLRWYQAALDEPRIVESFWLSLKLATFSSSIAVCLAVPAALALTRYRFAVRDAINAFLMSPLMIPNVVLGVAFLRFFNLAGLSGSVFLLTMTHVIFIFPYALRLVLASATGMDREVEMAARSLGAGKWRVHTRIILPLILPGLTGGWLLSFIQSFDELTMTVFVATPGTTTLPVWMYNHIAQTIDPLITSVSAILIIATAIMMILMDRLVGLDKVLIGKG